MHFLSLNETPLSTGQKNASLKRYYQKNQPKLKKIKNILKKKTKIRHFSTKISINMYF